ncbi:EAL domain-containing protein [Nocardioides pelophilus]|uniref:EAL domain-containing protein n=1 Tax=Nocardioides pelophilus TaxID=2172019 RepID=UPI001FECBABD|nr:EAL domain-containing protein [Nocardioides pelophilus]
MCPTNPVAAADAATMASGDAASTAQLAKEAAAAASDALDAAGTTATTAKYAAADTVAAAASAAAEIAALTATAVQEEASSRAMSVAAAAVKALVTIAADLPDDVDPEGARRVAAAVAATVAADVIAQAKLTDEAAAKVSRATALAAEAAALAALAAASIAEIAAGTAEESASVVTGATDRTELASALAVQSTSRVAELALRRVSQLRLSSLVLELRRALDEAELLLHYQPMYSVDSGEIVAVEALLRWQHPSRGLLLPAAFLAAAEGPHLVAPVGDWVIETAIAQATQWQRAHGDRAPLMWVNISCDQLGRRHLVGVIERLLTESDLPPGRLGVEITERQLAIRVDDVAADLLALHELGVALAVDDFGTGYASLDYLRRFTFNEIKIDRSFVSGLEDRTDRAVTASIVALGRALDLTVVAEGVETQAQFDQIKELGCHVSQGYLHHRPAPPQTISDLLHQPTT